MILEFSNFDTSNNISNLSFFPEVLTHSLADLNNELFSSIINTQLIIAHFNEGVRIQILNF